MISALSVHESAHAIAGERLHLPVRSISVVSTCDYAGIVRFDKQQVPSDVSKLARLRAQLRCEALTSLAGPIGEAHFTHEPLAAILHRCDGDRRAARQSASAYALCLPQWDLGARYQIFADWLEEATHLVHNNWSIIVMLAERLSLNGTLGAADVCRIIALADRAAA